jgi:hypothetical protein
MVSRDLLTGCRETGFENRAAVVAHCVGSVIRLCHNRVNNYLAIFLFIDFWPQTPGFDKRGATCKNGDKQKEP